MKGSMLHLAALALLAPLVAGCGPGAREGGMEVDGALVGTQPIPVEINYWQYRPDAVKIGPYRGFALRFDDHQEGADPTYGFKVDTAGEEPLLTECTVVMKEPRHLDCKAGDEVLSIRLDAHGVATEGEADVPSSEGPRKVKIAVKSRTSDGRQLTRGVGYQLADGAGALAEMEMTEPPTVWMRRGLARKDGLLTSNILVALYLLRLRLEGAVRLHPNINGN